MASLGFRLGGQCLVVILLVYSPLAWGQVEPRITSRQRPNNVQRPQISENEIQTAFREAKQVVAQRREDERRGVTTTGRRLDLGVHGAEARHQLFLLSFPKTIELENIQKNFEEATLNLVERMNLSRDQVVWDLPEMPLRGREVQNDVSQCESEFQAQCDRNSKYRTLNGSCNNLRNPSWGRSFTCFRRLLPAVYGNSVNTPRTNGRSGRPLPTPRSISLGVHRHIDRPARRYTHLFMVFGQFLDHDITLTPLTRTSDNLLIQCCPDNDHPQCMPIILESNDPFFSQFGQTCMNFVRSTLCPTCTLGVRQQTNQVTTFIDASTLYGSTVEDGPGLRTEGGKLLAQDGPQAGGDLLPQSANPNNDQCSLPQQNQICFRSGDNRVNQHPGIAATHTIWLRQHNRLAEQLKARNPRWTDEKVFQEARRIVGAQIQMITYGEFLPVTLGPDFMRIFNLRVRNSGYTSYDSTTNPTLYNEFSTAAFRFGHSTINTGFAQLNSRGAQSGAPLRDYFLWPFELYTGQVDTLFRGTTRQPAQSFDNSLVPDVTEFCYRRRGNATGLDLASLNIQRGRDHGIPGYTELLFHCFSHEVRSFSDLQFIEPALVRRLQTVYESVSDIDMFTGGVSETPMEGAAIGPTFGCLVGLQFNHLKFGDRFYFEHGRQAGSFTPAQLEEIRKTKYAKVICDNSNIDEIQVNVFRFPSRRNQVIRCDAFPDINLAAWDGQ